MQPRASAQEQRHAKWLRLAPPQTHELCTLVLHRSIPRLASAGFRPVECTLGNSDWPVSGREVELERLGAGYIDSVTFNFDKYMRPRFQVHASRRSAEPPHRFIHAGNLVSRRSQYYHYWGKPWWLPSGLWSTGRSAASAAQVEACLGQLLRLLENGERGANISKDIIRDAI